jgi:predicted nucleotidyltransferase component of viral defense system
MLDDAQPLKYLDDLDLLRAALTFTESATDFSARLVEKDYYCSLLLHDFALAFQQGMVFKGGTCLSKVYVDFYRFSEDLDFVIPVEIKASRSDRRTLITHFRGHLTRLSERLPCFHVAEPLH